MKFTFHRDQFGVHVYYAGMNKTTNRRGPDLKINSTVDFDASTTCVVPPVMRVSSCSNESQTTGYKNKETGKTMTVPAYEAEKQQLEHNSDITHSSLEEEVSANVAWRRFQDEWQPESKEVEVHTDYEFEVVDIEYPADERLIPLRHIDGEKINYFKVDGSQVAFNLAHDLCKSEGLEHDNDGDKRGTYSIPSYGLEWWQIEGVRYGRALKKLSLHRFTGNLSECRKYINEIECAVRACFDEWTVSGKTALGLTVGMVTKHLDEIASRLQRIDSKIKTRSMHNSTLAYVQKARLEVVQIGLEEEKLNDLLDSDEDIE
jgi:hypothetical protein